jgi:hypothetical protein
MKDSKNELVWKQNTLWQQVYVQHSSFRILFSHEKISDEQKTKVQIQVVYTPIICETAETCDWHDAQQGH